MNNDVEMTIKTNDGEKAYKGVYAVIGMVSESEDSDQLRVCVFGNTTIGKASLLSCQIAANLIKKLNGRGIISSDDAVVPDDDRRENEPDVSTDSDCSTKEGHQPDTGGHCPESRPGMSGIDREALLALADEIAESVDYRMSRGEICAPIGIYVLRGYARRIREALGVGQ